MARQHYAINPDPVISINDESGTFVETNPTNSDYNVRNCRIHSSANAYDVSEPYTLAPFEHNLPDIDISESGQGTVIATSEGGIDVSISIASIVAILDNDSTDRAALVAALLAGNASLQSDLQSAYGGGGQMVVTLGGQNLTFVTLTNHPNSERFLANREQNRTKLDLTDYTECRLVATVVSGSVSGNSPRILLKYRTADSTTISDYSDLGASGEISCSISSSGVIDSGWISINASAQADVFIAVADDGGDGASDPTLGLITAHFR